MTTQDDTFTRSIVYVVDDDASVRNALTRVFKSHGMSVESFESARDFLEYERADVPCCLLLDVNMPGQTGIELQDELAEHHVDLPIVFITAHGDIPMTVKAMQLGATDFLPKPVNEEHLVSTVQTAIERHTTQRLDNSLLRDFIERVQSLSKREHQVMLLVIEGLLNKQIAKRLSITEHTVKVHRGRMMEKTGVDSVAELVRLYERSGIASQDN